MNSIHTLIKLGQILVKSCLPISLINIDYLMVGLRYGFHPRVTDVISRTSKVRASE